MSKYIIEKQKERPERWKKQSKYIKQGYEQKASYGIAVLFMFVYYVLPQYFGLNTPGFDLTAQRIMIILMTFFVLTKVSRVRIFYQCMKECKILPLVCVYLIICGYTAILNGHIGTLLYSVIEILGLFLLIYIMREFIRYDQLIQLLIGFTYVLCILGLFEYVMQKTPFVYLETIKGLYTGGMIRSGSYRVMGPANHSLAYGLILICAIPLCCLDVKKDTINILKNWPLLVLIILNVFLTGSRSTLAVSGLAVILLLVFSEKAQRKRILLVVVPIGLLIIVFALVFSNLSFSRYILLQLSSVIDELFGTTFALRYGADLTTLKNSAGYRELLVDMFGQSWLSPWLGKGSGYKVNWYYKGFYFKSIDNFYLANYIRYAYPGMITYCVLVIQTLFMALRSFIKRKSGLSIAMFVGILCYFINLWWMDTLQTIKYVYILFAIYFVYEAEIRERNK